MSSVFNTPVITPLLRIIARTGLKLSGWRVDKEHPIPPPYVFIGAPHTSNWDFMLMLALLLDQRMKARWLGKDSLFAFPFGALMRWCGGIPVDRSQAQDLVPQTAQWLKTHPDTVLCVPPEGTRKKVDHWKTGFYYIAHAAQVPILMTVIDADKRMIRILGVFEPTGNAEQEIPAIQRQYCGYRGIIAENTCNLDKVCPTPVSAGAAHGENKMSGDH